MSAALVRKSLAIVDTTSSKFVIEIRILAHCALVVYITDDQKKKKSKRKQTLPIPDKFQEIKGNAGMYI